MTEQSRTTPETGDTVLVGFVVENFDPDRRFFKLTRDRISFWATQEWIEAVVAHKMGFGTDD